MKIQPNIYSMKLCLTLFLLHVSIVLSAQTNNFAPIGATWYYTDIDGIDYDDTLYTAGYTRAESVGDAIIDGIACRQITFTGYLSTGEIYDISDYYCYENEDKVYFHDGTAFKLLYDFSGDNWYAWDIFYFGEDSTEIIVDSVKYEDYDGTLLKTLYVHDDFTTSFTWLGNKITERLGGASFMFMYYGADDTYFPSGLRCYSDSVVNFTNTESPCDSLIPEIVTVEELPAATISLFQSGDMLQINGANINASVSLMNLNGQTICNVTFSENTTINLPALSTGIYFVVINDKSGSTVRKMFWNQES